MSENSQPSTTPVTTDPPLLVVRSLSKNYSARAGRHHALIHAVADVSFDLRSGQTLGVVGESGCGKSTLARLLLGIEQPTSGTISIGDQTDSSRAGRGRRERKRAQQIQMVFQDPYDSLNPRATVLDSVLEPMLVAKTMSRKAADQRAQDLLADVGLDSHFAPRYPHELSGGQRQRVGIARALALSPQIVVLDEPVSGLDVSIQAQVVNLLMDLQAEHDFAVVMIAHDLAVVQHTSDHVVVMYLGRVVESGRSESILTAPSHPYTRMLMDSVPVSHPSLRGRPRTEVQGELPSPLAPPPGCAFASRCPRVTDRCRTTRPLLEPDAAGHLSACFHPLVPDGGIEVTAEKGTT